MTTIAFDKEESRARAKSLRSASSAYLAARQDLADVRVIVRKVEEAMTREAKLTLATAASELLHAVAQAQGVSPEVIEKGQQNCPSGPAYVCFYNVNVDPNLDCCLYCDEPHERK